MSQQSGFRPLRAALLLLVPVAALAMFGIEAASASLMGRTPASRSAAAARLDGREARVAPVVARNEGGVVQKADFEETSGSGTGIKPGRGR